ncbi:MAG: hypothetical protein IPK82_17085 [Polyangiaceae bacterium]|nr:hypothetical protein [Polyangiaceae bacterium]
MSLALGKLACSPAAPTPAETPPPPVPSAVPTAPVASATVAVPEPPPPVADPSPLLKPYAQLNANYARRVVYTWTTKAQIDELRVNKTLLSRSESPKYGRSFFDVKLDFRWVGGDKFAGLLRAQAFRKARFAWHAPWATLLGYPGETYGTELLRVTLKPEAWIVYFSTSDPGWDVRDTTGKQVTVAEAQKHPERIAAIFFLHDAVALPTPGSAPSVSAKNGGREAYREYVLCNESMIESWEVGTQEVMNEIASEAAAIEAAATYFERHRPVGQRVERWNAHVALLVWKGHVELTDPASLYESALAFPNQNYLLDAQTLTDLAAKLRAIKPSGEPILFKPNVKFPGAKPEPVPPPPPPKKWRGTFY